MDTGDQVIQIPTNAQIIQDYISYFQKNHQLHSTRFFNHRLNLTDKLGEYLNKYYHGTRANLRNQAHIYQLFLHDTQLGTI